MPPRPPLERPTKIALNNDLDVLIDGAAVRGEPDDTLTFRAFVAVERDDAAPLHASVSADAEPVGDGSGDYIATIAGQSFASPLGAYLHRRVWIVAESVPPGAYRDAFAVTVVEDQSA